MIRELQNRRVADEAAAKKKLEQQQEKVQKEKAKEIHFDINVVSRSRRSMLCRHVEFLVDGEKFFIRSHSRSRLVYEHK